MDIPADFLQKGNRLMLNLGQVNYFAEIWVNGKLAKVCPWAPFETDITQFARPGSNTVSVVVANLLANRATWNILDGNLNSREARWWHNGTILREKEKLISGLLGPVTIVLSEN